MNNECRTRPARCQVTVLARPFQYQNGHNRQDHATEDPRKIKRIYKRYHAAISKNKRWYDNDQQ